jgi:hypothetical protein
MRWQCPGANTGAAQFFLKSGGTRAYPLRLMATRTDRPKEVIGIPHPQKPRVRDFGKT